MLKTIKGYRQTQEAATVMAAIEQRVAGAALFAPEAPKPATAPSQAPSL